MDFVRRRPLTVFFILSVAIALVAMWIRTTDPGALGEALGDMMAKNKPANIFTAIEYSMERPSLWHALLFPFAPTLAALIVVLAMGGGEFRQWLSRLAPWRGGVSTASGISVWLLSLAIFMAFVGLYFIMVLSSGDHEAATSTVQRFGPTAAIAILGFAVAMLLSPGALLEEMGWRGFALPMLLRSMSPLAASIVLGLMWAAWHLPREIMPLMSGAEGVWFKFMVKQASFVPGCIAGSILATYLFFKLGGSVWSGVLAHAFHNELSVNIIRASEPLLDLGGGWAFRGLTIIEVALAVILLLIVGPKLGQEDSRAS